MHKVFTSRLKALLLICAISLLLTGCGAGEGYKEGSQAESIWGYYAFEENIYTSLFSSYMPMKGHMPYYGITEDKLIVINRSDGSAQEYPGVAEKKPLGKELFIERFNSALNTPDISGYKECYEVAAYSLDNSLRYRLFLMDGEVWLVGFSSNDTIWSIYKLVRTNEVKPGDDGQYSIPPEPAYELSQGWQLEIWNGKDMADYAYIDDRASIDSIEGLIQSLDFESSPRDNKPIESIGTYIRFYDGSGKDDTLYYVFWNETIAESPQIQRDLEGTGRIDLTLEQYEKFYALWESHLMLPAAEARSGSNTVSCLVLTENEEIDLDVLRSQISWLKIDNTDDYVPFRVYIASDQVYGMYEVYDAQTYEKLDFIMPSGLEPQTYLLQNAQEGHSYIIRLSTGYGVGTKRYGMKILFGVSL